MSPSKGAGVVVVTAPVAESRPMAVTDPVVAASQPVLVAAPPSCTVPLSAPAVSRESRGAAPAPAAGTTVATQKLSTMSTKNLVVLPALPLHDADDMVELIQLTSAVKGSVEQILGSIGVDFASPVWTRGWESVLKRRLLSSVRRNHPTSASVKQVIGAAVTACQKALDAGASGAEALDGVLRALSAGLSSATPASVLQKLQNFSVSVGTTFKVFLEELVVLVTSVQEIGFAEDGTLQVAVKACLGDQFATLSAPVLHGRNARALPYASVAEFLFALEDLADNLTPATASTRARGRRVSAGARGAGPLPSGRRYGSSGSPARSGGSVNVVTVGSRNNVMTVDQYDDESREFWQVHQVHQDRPHDRTDPPFYKVFSSNEERDNARRAFGLRCLNCGAESPFHLARDCTEKFMNVSGLLHPDLAVGDAATVERNFRSWQQRLNAWAQQIRARRDNSSSRSPRAGRSPSRGGSSRR